MAVILLFSAVSELALLDFVLDIMSGGPFDEATADTIDATQALIAIVRLLLQIASVVTFLWWFHRAYKNLHVAGVPNLRFSPSWAIGGFFVPILNLYRPYHIMKEVWHGYNTT